MPTPNFTVFSFMVLFSVGGIPYNLQLTTLFESVASFLEHRAYFISSPYSLFSCKVVRGVSKGRKISNLAPYNFPYNLTTRRFYPKFP